MNDTVVSYIRTWVPIAVGAAAAWLAAHFGIVIDESSKATVTLVFGSIITGAYYAIVRGLEQRFPQLGWLLGIAKAPAYVPGPAPAPDTGEDAVAVIKQPGKKAAAKKSAPAKKTAK